MPQANYRSEKWDDLDIALECSATELIRRTGAEVASDFSALQVHYGLDPKNDFRFSDLSGVDLSNSDLRGFDFTGADLTHVFGSNVRYDNSTILDGADLGTSMFAFTAAQRKFFQDNPFCEKQVEKLKDAHWTGVELWLGKNIDNDPRERTRAMRIAARVFDESVDSSVKSSVMFFSRFGFSTADEHKDLAILHLSNPRWNDI